ncbi:uncharacterized protein VTP21DRAFT_10342 [Calcarisporiella thermophila]|uniref:uncharacterized protein n=1 Tax=Calcarisporiella thermophila TaxID=911321 RepID=UPI0037434DBF
MSKLAVIVGVGPGLGASLARKFASQNLSVAMLARNQDFLTQLQSDITKQGGNAASFQCDITSPESVKNAFEQIEQKYGSSAAWEVGIYNAGGFSRESILEIDPEKFTNVWKVNCLGALLFSQQLIPRMLKNNKGTLLFTGATASLRGSAKFATLSTGKFGLRALVQSLAREFQPQGIHISHVIVDGIIRSDRTKSMTNLEDGKMLNPDKIAETYFHLYQQDKSVWTHELDIRPSSEIF